jgi:hypothetical protein
LGSAGRRKRAHRALEELGRAALGDPAARDIVVRLLESAAEIVGQRRAPAAVPGAERLAWESLGACFDQTGMVEQAALRSRAAWSELRASSLDGDTAVAELLDVDRSRISQRVSERSLFAVAADGGRWFPAWQFDGRRTLPHLRDVLRALDPELHPLTVAHWVTTPHGELVLRDEAVSPRTWLVTGGAAGPVAELAALL